ncbi:PREDICTED: hydrocephalus-inducing protein homolog [Cyphomyrmex costatus]|uniref:hydrocephalus-inducing protein homolog n=1 Tax=Cyphomyrmex costatus TaxID=456900 RepID=UPI0008524142|nr:PREDICTED: hydrocephalus-inducing protein homolog [Cyphomyrmex costatus]
MTIPVKFLPNIKPDYPYSRNYSGVLWFEYEEHPTKNFTNCSQINAEELQDSDSENLLMEIRSEMLDETLEKLRSTFMSTTETSYLSCLDDPEILTRIDPHFEPPTKEPLDDILDIIPHEGVLQPFSSQYVRFIFHASEPMQLKVVALCEIIQGPTEIVNVYASADVIRYSVDKQIIDFGQQLFGELCRSSFTLQNHSMIRIDYKINKRNFVFKTSNFDFTIGVLTIEPNKGSIGPLSSLKITLELQPMLLGTFEVEFELQVTHVDPLIITAKGVISYPQVYPCISRDISRPVKLGYRAIQLLSPEFITMKKQIRCNVEDDKLKNQVPEWDERILLNNGWDLISCEEIFPSIVDIEMSIDRLLAIRSFEENASILIKHFISHKIAVIPFLYTPEYIIDMGYIAIDIKTCYSTTIVNYGPWNAEITMKKSEKKQLENSGIFVKFEKTTLTVGKTTCLTIIWQPTTAKYYERSTREQHTIYLEISRGSIIPIIIKSIITYPFVIVDTKLLDFQNVIVGECLMMNVLCRMEANLKITVKMGLETQVITLIGNGIEYKLRISDLDISFPPTVLFTEVLEKTFTIKNICNYPVEFFWHHLDSFFLEEERIAEALTRYYGVKEILLPPRKLGERMPPSLMEFYNSLKKYQETACRSAKALQIPLLCIDNVIIEGIALGDNWVSIKLRQIIDDAYQEYLSAFKRYKNDLELEIELSVAKKTDVEIAKSIHKTITKKESPKEIKSPKATKSDLETTAIDEDSESDTLPKKLMILFETEFAKLPREQDLKYLDSISLYEYKIQTILLLQKIFPHYATIESKVNEKNQNDTFLGIEIDLLTEAFRER